MATEGFVEEEDSDVSEGSDGSGWFADPDIEGQERYFDGSEWTTETRPADSDAPVLHLPEHTGELQRALAAATDDIDDVEDRLGTLFDRAEQHGERQGRGRRHRAPKEPEPPAEEDDPWASEEAFTEDSDVVEDEPEDETEDEAENWLEDEDEEDEDDGKGEALEAVDADPGQNVYVGDPGSVERGMALASADQEVDNDDDALSELDEALASEEPLKVKRSFFRRRS